MVCSFSQNTDRQKLAITKEEKYLAALLFPHKYPIISKLRPAEQKVFINIDLHISKIIATFALENENYNH